MSISTIRNAEVLGRDWASFSGTKDYPGVVSVFLKSDQLPDQIQFKDEQIPLNLFDSKSYSVNHELAVEKIKVSSRVILHEIQQRTLFEKDSQFIIACENLMRGMVQMVPVLGCKILHVYNKIKISFIHFQLTRALKEEQNLVGIAFDSKPIFTVPLSSLRGGVIPEGGDLEVLYATWLLAAEEWREQNSTDLSRSALDVAEQIRQRIQV